MSLSSDKRTVKKARIIPPESFGDKALVIGEMSDGSYLVLISFFNDELHFCREEFIGLTHEECWALHAKKDKAYLQS